MGNSGSIHNIAIGLDENQQYPYHYQQPPYHNQPPPQQQNHLHQSDHYHPQQQQYPSHHWSSSQSCSTNDIGPQSQPHIKVLPEPSKPSRLRPTTNGTILQSGGTISGRRESLNPNLLLQRSSTTLHESSGFNQRRASDERTDVRRLPAKNRLNSAAATKSNGIASRDSPDGPISGRSKRFGSEPDLRVSLDEDNNSSSGAHLRVPAAAPSKSKIVKTKKKMAPQPIPVGVEDTATTDSNAGQPQRRLRLFKTKAESRKLAERTVSAQNAKTTADGFDYNSRKFDSPERSSASPRRHFLPIKTDPKPSKPGFAIPKNGPPVFRREKSFDISLLRDRHRDLEVSTVDAVIVPSPIPPDKPASFFRQRSNNTSDSARYPQAPPIRPKLTRSRKYSQPALPLTAAKHDFKEELQAATKRRSVVSSELVDKPFGTERSNSFKLKSKNKLKKIPEKKSNQTESDRRENLPIIDSNPTEDSIKERSQSKIPQLTKTFYFGMEKSSDQPQKSAAESKPSLNDVERPENFAKIQIDVIDQFAKSIFTTQEYQRAESESSESALSSEEGRHLPPMADTNLHYDSESSNTAHIQVHIRPTLPRRQLEIPRFSPAAAWRMLNEIRSPTADQAATNANGTDTSQPSQPVRPLERRIQRIIREPNPMYPDNKSGDSGISGDAGLPEHMDSPRNQRLQASKTRPFLTAWTPQQDLDEDDEDDESSSDGDVGKPGNSSFPSRGHTFSLSLPRENQFSIYEEKEKIGFNSLQKLKRTVSGVFNGNQSNNNQQSSVNYRNDNWLLSRSAPNSIDNSQLAVPALSNNGNSHDNGMQSSTTLSHLAGGKHLMYLPNQPLDQPKALAVNNNHPASYQDNQSNKPSSKEKFSSIERNQKRELSSHEAPERSSMSTPTDVGEMEIKLSNRKSRGGHRFTFQSTVRQIERRRIADKLSKEAEQKEAQRLSESEAMRRVEEEFQRKRAGEKASIRHQLRLFSLEESQCTSLPVDWQTNPNVNPIFDQIPFRGQQHEQQRAEPDGAVSPSPAASPTLRSRSKTRLSEQSIVPVISVSAASKTASKSYVRKDESRTKPESRMRPPQYPSPQTEILSEFRTPRREYFDYRSSPSSYRSFEQHQTEHSEVVCKIPSSQQQQKSNFVYDADPNHSSMDRQHLAYDAAYCEQMKVSRSNSPSI